MADSWSGTWLLGHGLLGPDCQLPLVLQHTQNVSFVFLTLYTLNWNLWESLRFSENSLHSSQYSTTEKKSVVLYWLKFSEFSPNIRDTHWFQLKVSLSVALNKLSRLAAERAPNLTLFHEAPCNLVLDCSFCPRKAFGRLVIAMVVQVLISRSLYGCWKGRFIQRWCPLVKV